MASAVGGRMQKGDMGKSTFQTCVFLTWRDNWQWRQVSVTVRQREREASGKMLAGVKPAGPKPSSWGMQTREMSASWEWAVRSASAGLRGRGAPWMPLSALELKVTVKIWSKVTVRVGVGLWVVVGAAVKVGVGVVAVLVAIDVAVTVGVG